MYDTKCVNGQNPFKWWQQGTWPIFLIGMNATCLYGNLIITYTYYYISTCIMYSYRVLLKNSYYTLTDTPIITRATEKLPSSRMYLFVDF